MIQWDIAKVGDWAAQLDRLDPAEWVKIFKQELEQAVFYSCSHMEGLAKKNISDGRPEWPPMHPWTLIIRSYRNEAGLDQMKASGALFNAITKDQDGLVGWTGVFRRAKRDDDSGNDYANIAWIVEHGITIKVTTKMRRWLLARGIKIKASTQVLRIRARPFLRPAFEESKKEIDEIAEAAVRRALQRIRAL